jgi:hypothetical protein
MKRYIATLTGNVVPILDFLALTRPPLCTSVDLPALLTDADTRERVEQSKYIQEPQHHADDHDCI